MWFGMAVASAGPYANNLHLALKGGAVFVYRGGQGWPAGDVSHKPGGRLSLVSARPAVAPATLKRTTTNFAAW